MVNGYVTLDLASTNIYKEALGAIKAQKPVMVVDAPDVYFADTIKTVTDGDDVNVEITKGGKTITINDVNAVSSTGDIQVTQQKLYLHTIRVGYSGSTSSANAHFSILLPTNVAFTKSSSANTLAKYLYDNMRDKPIACNGEEYTNDLTKVYSVLDIKAKNDTEFIITRIDMSTGIESSYDFSGTGANASLDDSVSDNIFDFN